MFHVRVRDCAVKEGGKNSVKSKREAGAVLGKLEAKQWQKLYLCRYDRKHRDATIPVLAELLAHDDRAIRHRTLRAIGRVGPCDTIGALSPLVPLVCEFVEHDDELTRAMAVGVLFGIGRDDPESAVPALVAACDQEELLEAALLALVEMGPAAKKAAPCFHRFARHRNGKVRRIVMRGFGAIGADDARSRKVLQAALNDRNKAVRETAEKALARPGKK